MTASEGPPEYRWCQAHRGLAGSLSGGQGRNIVPARSAISGTVVAVVMVVATLTFGSSLSTLVSHPPCPAEQVLVLAADAGEVTKRRLAEDDGQAHGKVSASIRSSGRPRVTGKHSEPWTYAEPLAHCGAPSAPTRPSGSPSPISPPSPEPRPEVLVTGR